MTKEYEAITYGRIGETPIIGEAHEVEDGVIRIFNWLQPVDGVFYLRPVKEKKKPAA